MNQFSKTATHISKGLLSFLLLFVFLYSGVIKGYVNQSAEISKPQLCHAQTSKQKHYISVLEDDQTQCQETQISESDSDLDEIAFCRNSFIPANELSFSLPKNAFPKTTFFHEVEKLPLYDLFCNWKFHLLG